MCYIGQVQKRQPGLKKGPKVFTNGPHVEFYSKIVINAEILIWGHEVGGRGPAAEGEGQEVEEKGQKADTGVKEQRAGGWQQGAEAVVIKNRNQRPKEHKHQSTCTILEKRAAIRIRIEEEKSGRI